MTKGTVSMPRLRQAISVGLLGGAVAVACAGVDPSQRDERDSTSSDANVRETSRTDAWKAGPVLARELAADDSRLAERFLPSPEVSLRVHGGRILPQLSPGAPALTLGVSAGARLTDSLDVHPIDHPEQNLSLRALRARDVSAHQLPDGRLLYENAFTGTDLILSGNHNRVSYTLVLKDERSPADFVWSLGLGNGLRPLRSTENETAIVDQEGKLRITVRQVSIVDAHGYEQVTPLELEEQGLARFTLEQHELSYPVLAQFDIETPPIGLSILPPEVIKGRVMVIFDTSGSMIWEFDTETDLTGDSDDTALLCDNLIGTGFRCDANVACSSANGAIGRFAVADPVNNPSRMLAAKAALYNVVNAQAGLLDFGLIRFAGAGCSNADYCCQPQIDGVTPGRCFHDADNRYPGFLYPLPCQSNGDCVGNCGGSGYCACSTSADCPANFGCDAGICVTTNRENTIAFQCSSNSQCGRVDNDCGNSGTYAGYCDCDSDNDCPTGFSCNQQAGTDPCWANAVVNLSYAGGCGNNNNTGGRILETPGAGSNARVRQWVDFVEDFCSSTGAVGGRPRNPELRADGSTPLARSVRVARQNWYQPIYNGETDPKIDCRPYVLVAMTDGNDTCSLDPSDEVADLTAINSTNPVKTYVLGMGSGSGLDTNELNAMAVAGGTGPTAPVAQNQDEIEATFADIVAETVKFEQCNAVDDNCNDRIDEGLNVYQECASNSDCGSNNCSFGRCTCSGGNDAQCGSGFSCSKDDFCRPACSVGAGQCKNSGVRKCGGGSGQCCVDDGSASCTPLTPRAAGTEICNRRDDDCDGLIDEDFPQGCPVCVPLPEVCNGVDDDCDGLVDTDDPDLVGVGAPCGTDEGVCQSGTIICNNGKPLCSGEVAGDNEVCNGLDDDCNGSTDGQTQACYSGAADTEDVGVCHGGTQACTASPAGATPGVECAGANCWGACVGEVVPTPEICDGLDNDCDGDSDEGVPAEVQTCNDHGDCAGAANCNNGACRCNAGACSGDNVCGGDNVCHPPLPLTGENCCQAAFDGKCGVGVCQFGVWTCAGNQVSCVGGAGPSDEICDGLDNDCDGEVDEDLPGEGDPCQADGACGGNLTCVVESPGVGRIECVPDGVGEPEVCDAVDNDCDGEIDELPDVRDNDDPAPDEPGLGDACNVPPPGQDAEPCAPGTYQCVGGKKLCVGFRGPGTEVCDGADNDCDGKVDEDTCPNGATCIDGECAEPCRSGEFPCPFGRVCRQGYCVPHEGTSGSTTGSTAGSGSDGSGGGGGSGGSSGSGSSLSSGGSGGASSASGGTASGVTNGTGGSFTNTDKGSSSLDNRDQVYGLATGGSGCACSTGPFRAPPGLLLTAGLGLVMGMFRRRRRAAA